MAIGKTNATVIKTTQGSSSSDGYERPSDWLPIPTLDSTKDDIYILNGVGDFNQLMFRVVATGNVTVNWGDGNVETDAATTEMVFAHTYNYDEISDETYTNHNKTKQVLVHIYANRNTLKLFDMNGDYYFTNSDNIKVKYTTDASTNIYDVKANVQECSVWCSKSGSYVKHRKLEIFDWVGSITNTSMSCMFYYCTSLQKIPQLDTSNATSMYSMFNYCYSLEKIPQLDTSNATSMNSMFYCCSSLQTIPTIDTSNVTNMSSMFYNCYSLQKIPQLDTSNVKNMNHMFYNCYLLQSIPNLNTLNVTNMCNMFSICYSLQTINNLNTSNVKDMGYMFQYCSSLHTLPHLDTSNATSMNYTFCNCSSLQSINQLDISKVTDTSCIFYNCYSLQNPQLYKATKSFKINDCKMMTKQQIIDLINSISTVTDTQTITLGTTLQGYMVNVYVRPLENTHPSFYFISKDVQPVSEKVYYTYNEINKTYTLFTEDTFDSDKVYYELVYNNDEIKYEICESTDTNSIAFTNWVTTVKGWTIA